MRFHATILFAILAGSALVGCQGSREINTAIAENEIAIEVFGMDCPGCHGGLEKNIEKIPGVAKATANWKRQRVTLRLVDGAVLDEDAVTAAILASNFTPGKRVAP